MVFIALFLTLVTKAQVNPKEGFIITNQKDTIYGMIDYRTNSINAQQCVFKANDAPEYVTYAPGQIWGYRFRESGKFYVSKKFDGEGEFFAEFLVDGILNLYRKEKGFNKIYYLENEEGEVVSYENLEEDINYDQRIAKMRAQGLFRQVSKSQRAVDDIKVGNMSERQMIKMVRDYHEDVCTSNEECIRYEYDEENEGRNRCHFAIIAGGGYAACVNDRLWEGSKGGMLYSVGAGLEIEQSRLGTGMLLQIAGIYSNVRSNVKPLNSINMMTLSMGPMFRYAINSSVKFTTRLGLSRTVAFATYKDYFYKDEKYAVLDAYWGAYVGCGLEMPFQSHALNFNVEYRCLEWAKIHVIQGTLGFRF